MKKSIVILLHSALSEIIASDLAELSYLRQEHVFHDIFRLFRFQIPYFSRLMITLH